METIQQQKARLEARVEPQIYELLKRAAEIEGRTLTDFVVSAASSAARTTIEEDHVIRLSAEDQARFVESLLNPKEPTPTMVRAYEHKRRLTGK